MVLCSSEGVLGQSPATPTAGASLPHSTLPAHRFEAGLVARGVGVGDLERAFDELQQLGAGGANALHAVSLLARTELARLEEIGVAEQLGQRRTQLVRH